ncbi:MAG TPA: cytochrome c oxidase subunit 3 [Polyangiales bacterium]|nr:cytochrome c oxidase subunit 3 [Polyangiales bacterium]
MPGEIDIWVFVIGDMLIFSAYFAVYLLLDRAPNQALFLESQRQLSQPLGTANTLILLTSSLFVALSVQAARAGDVRTAARFVGFGGALGVGFLVLKSYEWYAKVRAGYVITSNAFFMHYYMLTSLHVAHVLVGLVFLIVIWRELRGAVEGVHVPRIALLEAGGVYWHMVDFLWILIFSLLYLVR